MGLNIFLLLVVNIVWGLIPWPAAALFHTYSSFTIVFVRFVAGTIIFAAIALAMILWTQWRKGRQSLTWTDIAGYLTDRNQAFGNCPQWFYLLLVGTIGLSGQLMLFFWGLKLLGAIVISIGFMLSLLATSIYNWLRGKEGMPPMKLLYLATLAAAAVLLGIGSADNANAASLPGIIVVLLYTAVYTFFFITSDTDRSSDRENQLARDLPHYPLIRTFVKLAVLCFFAAVTMPPLLWMLTLVSSDPAIGQEIQTFFGQSLTSWPMIATPSGLILIVGCTVIPFLGYYLLAAKWPRHSSFDLWAAALAIVEPVVNILIGNFVLHETFPTPWLVGVVLLTVIALLTRLLAETESQCHAILLLTVQPPHTLGAMDRLYAIRSVRRVQSLLGTYDLMVELLAHSSRELQETVNGQIHPMVGVKEVRLLMISRRLLDRPPSPPLK